MWLRRALVGFGVLAGGGVAAYFLVNNALSVPPYDGQESDHFSGERFKNPWPTEEHGFADFIRWQLSNERGPWREWTDAAQGPPPPPRVGGGRLRVTYVNHATTLVQLDGLNVLNDPVWSERAYETTIYSAPDNSFLTVIDLFGTIIVSALLKFLMKWQVLNRER